ncbi:TRAF3-interacting protein 1 [Trichoplusia ni]|uniref:TRAF3-interacting protein 1 n=1 Tax=Trichoplusia ni TaxID=7111 RepID=A0A7E5WQC2_TRINI|nr:TRAF3-interacting protein 1 [Trichoplusia ni]
MEKDIDPDVIKSTQISLSKYVKRPPLTEKLLKKPPFRFLHDIVTTVLKTTGFFRNLFDEEELVSDNVKDRDSKISFLNKVIFVLSTTTGKPLGAKPSKIVAGQEPEKTNELLQCLAQALDNKLSSDEAVMKYKDSSKSSQVSENKSKEPSKASKKPSDTKKLTSRSSEKLTTQKSDAGRTITKQDKEKNNEVKTKRKDNGPPKPEPPNSKKTQSKTVIKKNAREHKDPTKEENHQRRIKSITTNNIENVHGTLKHGQSQEFDMPVQKEEQIEPQLIVNPMDSPRLEQDDDGKLNSSYTIAENDLNSSSSSNDLLDNTNTDAIKSQEINISEQTFFDVDSQNQKNERNLVGSSRSFDADVNIKKDLENDSETKNVEAVTNYVTTEVKTQPSTVNDTKISRPASVRPSSSRPGAPRMREKVDNVVKDHGADNLLLGKVNIIIENTQNEEEEETSLLLIDQQEGAASSAPDQQEVQLSSIEHGHLVQQILDSQKELSHITGKTEIEWQFGAQKAREAMNQEIEQLRFNIQALSRVANPLGKLLDHIQEDVEVMRQELQQWSKIYEDVSKEMLQQKTLNEDAMTPFYTKLKQLDRDIEEKHDKINDLKILIHKNAFRIEKLLASGNVQ